MLSVPPCLPRSPPGHREEPYLTEAGRDTFDRFCRLCRGELQALGGGLLQVPQPVLVKECELVKDVLNVLIGVVSTTFSLCQVSNGLACEAPPARQPAVCLALYRVDGSPVQQAGSPRGKLLGGRVGVNACGSAGPEVMATVSLFQF